VRDREFNPDKITDEKLTGCCVFVIVGLLDKFLDV
jgi:hypothetical protein